MKRLTANPATKSHAASSYGGRRILSKRFRQSGTLFAARVHIDETLFGKDGIDMNPPLSFSANFTKHGTNPTKLNLRPPAPCRVEKQYGADSPFLLATLASEAKALRGLGKSEEAARLNNAWSSSRRPRDNRRGQNSRRTRNGVSLTLQSANSTCMFDDRI